MECEVLELERFLLSPFFTLPPNATELRSRLWRSKVELESIELLPNETCLRGVVRVVNLTFQKRVFVRFTLDSWGSHVDLQAQYVEGSGDGHTDAFDFTLPLPEGGAKLEFCLCYESSAGTFWANNSSRNYMVVFDRMEKQQVNEGRRRASKGHLVEALSDNANDRSLSTERCENEQQSSAVDGNRNIGRRILAHHLACMEKVENHKKHLPVVQTTATVQDTSVTFESFVAPLYHQAFCRADMKSEQLCFDHKEDEHSLCLAFQICEECPAEVLTSHEDQPEANGTLMDVVIERTSNKAHHRQEPETELVLQTDVPKIPESMLDGDAKCKMCKVNRLEEETSVDTSSYLSVAIHSTPVTSILKHVRDYKKITGFSEEEIVLSIEDMRNAPCKTEVSSDAFSSDERLKSISNNFIDPDENSKEDLTDATENKRVVVNVLRIHGEGYRTVTFLSHDTSSNQSVENVPKRRGQATLFDLQEGEHVNISNEYEKHDKRKVNQGICLKETQGDIYNNLTCVGMAEEEVECKQEHTCPNERKALEVHLCEEMEAIDTQHEERTEREDLVQKNAKHFSEVPDGHLQHNEQIIKSRIRAEDEGLFLDEEEEVILSEMDGDQDSCSSDSLTDEEMEQYVLSLRSLQRLPSGPQPSFSRRKLSATVLSAIRESVNEEEDSKQKNMDATVTSTYPVGQSQDRAKWGVSVIPNNQLSSIDSSTAVLYAVLVAVFLITAFYCDFLACLVLYVLSMYWLYCHNKDALP